MRLRTVWRSLTGVALAAGLMLIWSTDGGTQATDPNAAGRSALERPMLQTSVTSIGTQGGSTGVMLSRAESLTYPSSVNSDILTGDSWHGQMPTFNQNCNNEGRRNNMSKGEGIGLSLQVPASFPVYDSHAQGGYYVVLTGPRSDMLDEIIPMWFDPSVDPDLQYLGGEPRVEPSSSDNPGIEWRTEAPYYHPSTWAESLPSYLAEARLGRDPTRIENWRFGEYQTQGPPGAPSSRSDEWPEEMIVSKWTTLPGITFTRRTLGWSYQAWDDFILTELEFENTGDSDGDGARDLPDETLDGVYVSIHNNWIVSKSGYTQTRNAGDRWYHYEAGTQDDYLVYSENAGYSGPAQGLKMLLDWDGDSPEFAWDDRGDPVNLLTLNATCNTGRPDGEFVSFQYAGFGPIAYEDGGQWAFNSRDAGKYVQPTGDQPHAVRIWNIESETVSDDPRTAAHDRKTMYDMIVPAGVDPNPGMGAYFNAQVYGPYTLAPGEKAKIVMAWVGGSAAGENDIITWMRAHTRDFASLPDGEKWAVEFFNRARWAYDNEYDLPDAPPDVYVRVTNSTNATNQLNWNSADDAVNPDYGEKDVLGYRIYRSEWTPDGPWKKIDELAKGAHSYEDLTSAAGFQYWYSVRTYAAGHDDWAGRVGTMATLPGAVQSQVQAGLESGQWGRSQRSPGISSPKQPAVSATESMSRDPYIVPNPFRDQDANLQYPGKNELRIVGVPSKCIITIYSISGDMIAKVTHDDRTDNPDNPDAWLGEAQWDQVGILDGLGQVSPGAYFFVVESLVPESMGKIKSGKFMIIR